MRSLILSSSEGITTGFLRVLSLHDIESYVMNIGSSSKIARYSRFCKSNFSYPTPESSDQTEALAKRVDEYCRNKHIDIILPSGILGTFVLSKIKNDLSYSQTYPVSDPNQIYFLQNKRLFYQFLVQQDIPTSKTILIESCEQTKSLNLNFSVLLKPLILDNGER
jgi:predicted ATP-grasp superfamily ATP-dependent carboligase